MTLVIALLLFVDDAQLTSHDLQGTFGGVCSHVESSQEEMQLVKAHNIMILDQKTVEWSVPQNEEQLSVKYGLKGRRTIWGLICRNEAAAAVCDGEEDLNEESGDEVRIRKKPLIIINK